ncbi:hypothetical protein ACFQ36_07170 [Arthrobacter sp. GCM10027362]|uniref:hypothetical protein n=1 Tax=Arthrobacter sp. GCM10027362 TaxID=3273379 RepID=UPI00362A2D37
MEPAIRPAVADDAGTLAGLAAGTFPPEMTVAEVHAEQGSTSVRMRTAAAWRTG